MASVCRERDLEVTVAERAPAPLVGALGEVAAAVGRPGSGAIMEWMFAGRGMPGVRRNRACRCAVRRHLMITGMRRRAAG
ncbi:hypothetical protein [Streptomyces decoyicus]